MWQLNPPIQPQTDRETSKQQKPNKPVGVRYLWSGFVVTHLSPTTRLGFTPTDDWGTLIWIPRSKRREERVGDKRETEGQRRASGLTDACTNTRDADSMMEKNPTRPQSITDKIVGCFCSVDGLSKPLQRRETLVANQRLRISTKLGCGRTSFPHDATGCQRRRGGLTERWEWKRREGERRGLDLSTLYHTNTGHYILYCGYIQYEINMDGWKLMGRGRMI